MALIGCASAPPAAAPPTRAAPAEEAPLQLGPLSDFVPAAGLRWLVVGSPSYFARQPALAGLRERWLTDQRWALFARATGVDLLRTERALAAGFDLGTLYLADASGWVTKPEQPFIERLAGSARVQRTHSAVWRVTGLVGSTPEALVRLDDAVVAFAVQDPMLARIVEYRARGRLSGVVPALRGAALSGLPPEFLEPGPLRMYALGPFAEHTLPEGAGMLRAAAAVAAAVELEGDVLQLRLALAGSWDAERDREALSGLWQAVATAPLGRELGLDQPRSEPLLSASAAALVLALQLDAERVLQGLERVGAGRLEPLLPAAEARPPESAH
ncbi:MAG TPA: hypothetical protein VFS67_31400 [Polyangiaceae bacterium]|nr:hypothetical protein [Polyangiaceae bacterium]